MISVVMPVYNVSEYVADAIRSVLKQTYSDIELIIVNDGSTDSSLDVIDAYRYDPRVKVITTKNGGLAMARNVGLNYVTGEYLYFLDSDDIINVNLFTELMKIMSENDGTDLISFNYSEFTSPSEVNFKEKLTLHKQGIISNLEATKRVLEGKLPQMAWSYLCKTTLFKENKITFSDGKLFEDNNVAVKIMLKSKKVRFINFMPAGYYLRHRNGSITDIASKRFSKRELEDELFIFNDVYNVAIKKMDRGYVNGWYANKLAHLYIKYYKSLYISNPEIFLEIHTKLDKIYKGATHLSFRMRVRIFRAKYSFIDGVIRKITRG